jgi:hypothetical protein
LKPFGISGDSDGMPAADGVAGLLENYAAEYHGHQAQLTSSIMETPGEIIDAGWPGWIATRPRGQHPAQKLRGLGG